jgi:hydrogenase maturation protease
MEGTHRVRQTTFDRASALAEGENLGLTSPRQIPPPVSIAGAGHWLVEHDRIGPAVLDRLGARYGEQVELLEIGTMPLALLDYLRGQKLLVVVDAGAFGGAPGEVRVVEPDLDTVATRETSVHQIGPIETLCVAKHLWPDRLPRRICLVIVETDGIDEARENAAIDAVIARLDEEVERAISDEPSD